MGSAWASVLAHRDRLPRPLAKEGVRSNLTVPLLVGQNAVGAFFLDSVISNAYTERDIELVDPVAQQLALAIDNTRLFQEVEAKGRKGYELSLGIGMAQGFATLGAKDSRAELIMERQARSRILAARLLLWRSTRWSNLDQPEKLSDRD